MLKHKEYKVDPFTGEAKGAPEGYYHSGTTLKVDSDWLFGLDKIFLLEEKMAKKNTDAMVADGGWFYAMAEEAGAGVYFVAAGEPDFFDFSDACNHILVAELAFKSGGGFILLPKVSEDALEVLMKIGNIKAVDDLSWNES